MAGLLIAIFLGWFGGYRFYKKQIGLGILYLFTVGLFGIGWLVDIVQAAMLLVKQFTPPAAPVQNLPDPTPEVQNLTSSDSVFYIHASKWTDKNIGQIRDRFIVIDTETTGVNASKDLMISLAAVIYEKGQPTQTFYSLVNQPVHIPESATKVNGITDDMIRTAPSEHDVCRAFLEFCGDAIFSKTLFVAYNSIFDAKIIKNAMERYGFAGNIRHFDVLAYAKEKLSDLPDYKQTTVASHLGIPTDNAHNSKADCQMCAQILLKLIDM